MPLELIADIALDVPGRDSYSYRVPAAMALSTRAINFAPVPRAWIVLSTKIQ